MELDALEQALARLDVDQGNVARRDARAAVFRELRHIRGWVNRTYPRKEPKTRKKPTIRTPRKPRKVPEGYEIMQGMISPLFAAAGITVKLRRNEAGHRQAMIPKWALELVRWPRCTVEILKKAKDDVDYRKEVLMEKRWEERG